MKKGTLPNIKTDKKINNTNVVKGRKDRIGTEVSLGKDKDTPAIMRRGRDTKSTNNLVTKTNKGLKLI